MAFCPKCGNKVNDGDQFCVKCGNCLGSIAEQASDEKRPKAEQPEKRRKAPLLIAVVIVLVCAMVIAGFFYKGRKIAFSDDPTAIQQASKSVVLLECYDKNGDLYCTGSAFAAFEAGVFVTNYHVVEQEVYSIYAKTEDGVMFEINSVLASDPKCDIAILRTKANPNIAVLPIGSSTDLAKGEKIVAIGSPLGLLNTVSTGVFSGYNDTGAMNEIQFSASISHGSSGGALFNNAGEVIGITSASYTEGQNLNVAVPIQYAMDIKNNHTEEMTIPQFYDTFDHYNEYTVSDLLRNRNLKEDLAYVYGVVAKFKEYEVILVPDENHLLEYQRLLSEYNPIYNPNHRSYKDIFLDWDLKDEEKLRDFELNKTVRVYDSSLSKKLESQCQVGDVVCVLASIERWPYKDSVYKITIQSEEYISVLPK